MFKTSINQDFLWKLGMLIENRKSGFRSENLKRVLFLATGFQIYFLSFSSRKLYKNYQNNAR